MKVIEFENIKDYEDFIWEYLKEHRKKLNKN